MKRFELHVLVDSQDPATINALLNDLMSQIQPMLALEKDIEKVQGKTVSTDGESFASWGWR